MDARLIAWARRVKARRRQKPGGLPVLWLFADPVRLPDPRAAASRLPAGLCGVVLRHDGPAATAVERAARLAQGRAVAAICRRRRIGLVVAGDRWLAQAIGAGIHLRRGFRRHASRPPGRHLARGWLTSSAHDVVELRRAARSGADAIFLSPCFPTASHAGGAFLGVRRWAAMARMVTVPVLALGGIAGMRAHALPRICAGAGAIGALL